MNLRNLCDGNIVGAYLRANINMPVYIVIPSGHFQQIDTLEAGEVYPFIVNKVMNVGGLTWAVFVTNKDKFGNVNAWSETYIKIPEGSVETQNTPSNYHAPTSVADLFQMVKDNAGWIAAGLSILYLGGKYLGRSD